MPRLARGTSAADDAENLFWTGYAWLSRVDLYKDDPSIVAELFVGVAMMEKSVAIDPTLDTGAERSPSPRTMRGRQGEMDQSKQLFDMALAKTARQEPEVQLNYATSYACIKGDRTLYETLLNEVLAATDPDPSSACNLLAKRRARRALGKQHMIDCGFDMSSPARPAPSCSLPPRLPLLRLRSSPRRCPPETLTPHRRVQPMIRRSMALILAAGALLAGEPAPRRPTPSR